MCEKEVLVPIDGNRNGQRFYHSAGQRLLDAKPFNGWTE